MSSRKVRIGLDVGGTFTDAVVVDNETYEVIAKEKCPTTHHAKQGVAEGIVRNIENVLRKIIFLQRMSFLLHMAQHKLRMLF